MSHTLISSFERMIDHYVQSVVDKVANRYGIPRPELMDLLKTMDTSPSLHHPKTVMVSPSSSSSSQPSVATSSSKKNVSGYVQFCNDRRAKLKEDFPTLTFGEISKELGKIWRGLSSSEKEKYNLPTAPLRPNASSVCVSDNLSVKKNPTTTHEFSRSELEGKTLLQLKDVCTKFNVKKTGNKETLIKRITEFMNEKNRQTTSSTLFDSTHDHIPTRNPPIHANNTDMDDDDNNPLIFYENDSVRCSDDVSTTSSTSFILDNDDTELTFDYA